MQMPRITLGVSLKMYFGYQQTIDWCREIAALARESQAVCGGKIILFILPSFPALYPAIDIFRATAVKVGAQDLFWQDNGPFTGEVSGALLKEMGCCYAEVGHAERRRYFHEADAEIAGKTAAALRNGLTPVLCLGEERRGEPAQAVDRCLAQMKGALADAGAGGVILAYEPQWAIGADRPASDDYIRAVCRGLRAHLAAGTRDFSLIYGGSAGPGLLSRIGSQVDGLFLGRFAHRPEAFSQILHDAEALVRQDASGTG